MSSVGSAGDVGNTLGEHTKTHSGSWSGSALLLAVDDETLASLAAAAEGSGHHTRHQYPVSCTVILAVLPPSPVAAAAAVPVLVLL